MNKKSNTVTSYNTSYYFKLFTNSTQNITDIYSIGVFEHLYQTLMDFKYGQNVSRNFFYKIALFTSETTSIPCFDCISWFYHTYRYFIHNTT